MATMSLTDTDLRVREAVMRQLDWDPEVDSSAIGVAAKNGIVTLTGFTGDYSGKLEASGEGGRASSRRAWHFQSHRGDAGSNAAGFASAIVNVGANPPSSWLAYLLPQPDANIWFYCGADR